MSVVCAFGVYARPGAMITALRDFDYVYLVPILGLAFLNYVVRLFRWRYFLRVVDLSVGRERSAGIFFSGLAMSVTPGKLGELFKCLMLKREVGSAYSRSVPVVVNERLTDLVAVILLAAFGVARYPAGRLVFVVGLVGTVAVIVVLALSPRFAERLGGALARRFGREALADGSTATAATFTALLRARHFAVGTLLGVLAWFCECVAFWLVFPGLGWEEMSLFAATFVYAVATLAGAVTFLPGGLGATEASMAAMLTGLFSVPRAIAVAATLIIRACTLWFAVAVGVVAYVLHMRRFGQVRDGG